MKGYKGFSKGLVCKGKQYAENTVFEEEKAVICECGMHFCKNPLDVLEYYPLIGANGEMHEFAEVESLKEPVSSDQKKFTTTKLKIGAKLNLKNFVKASVNFLFEMAKEGDADNYATMASSGDSAKMASSGNSAKMASSGNSAQMASSGYSAQMASSGDSAQMASSGDSAQMASSGDFAKMASSGDFAQMASSGYFATMASSGYFAKMASSGDSAKMASSGDFAQMASSGAKSVVCGIGKNNIAKAPVGSWITLAEYENNGNRYEVVCVKTEYVDGDRIKADTWYELKNGKFEEANHG